LPKVGFVMLNPSRANASIDDPTLRRCISLAKAWGYGALEVVNLFAYCTANPEQLQEVEDPIGPENHLYLNRLPYCVDQVVVAWGNRGTLMDRSNLALATLSGRSHLYCVGITRHQQPRHPLYVPADTPLQLFESHVGGRISS